MVRNSKRRAFTIVELVIVIAVIAILAAVMIPTFGGVIESANVSADKQILSTINSQLAIYTGLGNKIETEADLWNALSGKDSKGDAFTGGSDLTSKLDPKSAKYGYHYWYNGETVELLTYDQINEGQSHRLGKMIVRADSVARNGSEPFAASAPRSFLNMSYYFLDKVIDGKGNEFSEFFDVIENLSTAKETNGKDDYVSIYNTALNTVSNGNKANETLAADLADRMAVTAILTDKPAIVGGAETITHVYIPENKSENKEEDYYLNHDGTKGITANVSATIVIPADIKLGDGCLDAFNTVTVKVDVAIENIADVISAGAVNVNATVQIGGVDYTISGSVVTNKNTNETLETKLTYKNPVTEDFVLSASGDYIDGSYIALHKINEGNFKVVIKNTEALTGKNGEATYVPYCQDLTWEIVTGEKVEISKDGTLTFKEGFNGSTITLKATPVAVNDVATAPTAEITLTVVKLSAVNFKFDGTNINLTSAAKTLIVDYGTVASQFTDFTYTFVKNGTTDVISGLDAENLGKPTQSVTTTNNHFSIDSATYAFAYNNANIKSTILSGAGYVSENVTVTVGEFTNTYEVRIEPTLFASNLPSYKSNINFAGVGADGKSIYKNHAYTIGDDNSIKLGHLFKTTDLVGKDDVITNIKVQTWSATGMSEGAPAGTVTETTSKNTIGTVGANWTEHPITLTDKSTNWISISTNTELVYIYVEVVDGYNTTDFVTPPTGSTNLVLHANVDVVGKTDVVVDLNNGTIYGNYYTVTAHDFYDPDRNTKNGHSLIRATGNCVLNQVIIDGPVYHSASLSASNMDLSWILKGLQTNKYGFFAYGVITGTSMVMNDTYISGFNSPVRINGTFEANNSVFEGGAWSNIFIAKSTSVVLTDSMTIQQHGGYESTITTTDNVADTILGMGIYVHGETQGTTVLNLDLNNTMQYNWVSSADSGKHGFYIDLAIDEIFKSGGPGAMFMHTIGEDNYVNAGVVSLGIYANLVLKKLDYPLYEGTVLDSNDNTYQYVTNQNVTESTVLGIVKVKAKAYSYQHGSSCNCDDGVNYVEGINFTYGVDTFKGEIFK